MCYDLDPIFHFPYDWMHLSMPYQHCSLLTVLLIMLTHQTSLELIPYRSRMTHTAD